MKFTVPTICKKTNFPLAETKVRGVLKSTEEERTATLRGLTIILQFHILAECDNGAALSATRCWYCQKTKTDGQKITLLQLRFSFKGQMW